jgi:hypothetical protein
MECDVEEAVSDLFIFFLPICTIHTLYITSHLTTTSNPSAILHIPRKKHLQSPQPNEPIPGPSR